MGDYGFSDKAQDENSIFGKIVSIDMKSKKHEIISLGHRNPQGLFYDKNSDVVLNTEHGPIGGDEININILKNNQKTTNFGWPKVAYGLMDDGSKPENSHEKFGFTPPIKYYDPAIGISEIIKLPNFDNLNHPNDFLVASMGWNNQLIEGDRSLQHIRFDQNFSKIISIEQIPIDQRVRDMIIEKEKRIVIMILENNPSLGILQF